MVKRTNKEIRKALLEALKDKKPHSYGELERKVNTNWRTIRDHVEYMELFDATEMVDNKVRITDFGLKKMKKL
jgi:predicted transcriptional regulator